MYLYFDKSLEIRLLRTELIILFVNDNDKKLAKETRRGLQLNKTAYEIITLIDGSKTKNEIVQYFIYKYKVSQDEVDNHIRKLLAILKTQYGINILESNHPIDKKITIKKEDNIYPMVASIELTNRCNLECIHCYGSYGPTDFEEMSLDEAKRVLDQLKEIDIRNLEFTGGDISVYPHIVKVIQYALDIGFYQINLLTNGVSISDELKEIIVKNKTSIFTQIDLHSLNEDYSYWFTKRKNIIPNVIDNIRYLTDRECHVKLVSIITPGNLHELRKLAYYAKELGAQSYGLSLVQDIGRAIHKSGDITQNPLLLTKEDDIKEYDQQINELMTSLAGFINIYENPKYSRPNCGSICDNISIAPSGKIKMCSMDNLCHFNSSIGNVFENTIKEIYIDKQDFVQKYKSIKAPALDLEECKDCEHRFFCGHCLLRGIIRAKQIGGKCKWKENYLPIEIAKAFLV